MNRNTEISIKKRMAKDEYYPSYIEREDQKDKGWKTLLSENLSLSQKAHVVLNTIIWAHYWRARIAIENSKDRDKYLEMIRDERFYPGYILDIEHYTSHWLASNGERLLTPEIMKTISDEFYLKQEENRYLPKGMTMYQFFKTSKE
jgi:hypothetical protein